MGAIIGTIDLGFYEKTLIYQLHKIVYLIHVKDVPYYEYLLSGFNKCSMILIRGEIEDIPSSG
jgi:hypothetical protein